MKDREAAGFGVVVFVITWCIAGVVGLIPWTGGTEDYVWHMNQDHAWELWALIVSLVAVAAGFIAYAVKKF